MERNSKKREELILAIDAGTQSIRATLIDLKGEVLHIVKTPIEPYFSKNPGWAEQEPEYYWEMLCKTCLELFVKAGDFILFDRYGGIFLYDGFGGVLVVAAGGQNAGEKGRGQNHR